LHCPKKKQKTLVKKNSLHSNSLLTGSPLLNVFLDSPRLFYSTIISLIILFFSSSTQAQSIDTNFQVIDSFQVHTTFLTTDALQQIYIATLLDRTLSAIKEIYLFDLNIFEVQAIGLSNDNQIWIYDPIEAQLKKINSEGDILFQSRHLKQATKNSLNINFLLERNNQLYLNDPSKGVFVFDNFGQLQQQLSITGIHHFQLLQEQLIYLKDGLIHYYNLETGETKTTKNPYLTKATMVRNLAQQIIIAQKDRLFLISRK